MAKLLCFVVLLVVASTILANAYTAPPSSTKTSAPARALAHPSIKKPPTFNLKCIIHNVAAEDVTFKLVIQGKIAGRVVVAKVGKWTAIGPVKVGCKELEVQVCVSVKAYKGKVVKKMFPMHLALVLKHIVLGCSKLLTLTACEVKSWKGEKLVVVKLGCTEAATLKI